MTIVKAGPSKVGALDTIEVGDQVSWYHHSLNRDLWGRVGEILEHVTRPGVNGPVFMGVRVRVFVKHMPVWTPERDTLQPRTVDVFLERFSSMVKYAYTSRTD